MKESRSGSPGEVPKRPVRRQQAGAGVDQKQHNVGFGDGVFGLRPHTAEKRAFVCLLQPCRIDDAEGEIAEPRVALAPVARDAGAVVDERQFFPDEPVEQRRFADVRTPDDGDGGRHRSSPKL